MLCEKCQAKPANVRIQSIRDNSGEALSTPIEHHFCGDCARNYIQADPQLKKAKWSKPTKVFKTNNLTPPARKDSKPPVK